MTGLASDLDLGVERQRHSLGGSLMEESHATSLNGIDWAEVSRALVSLTGSDNGIDSPAARALRPRMEGAYDGLSPQQIADRIARLMNPAGHAAGTAGGWRRRRRPEHSSASGAIPSENRTGTAERTPGGPRMSPGAHEKGQPG